MTSLPRNLNVKVHDAHNEIRKFNLPSGTPLTLDAIRAGVLKTLAVPAGASVKVRHIDKDSDKVLLESDTNLADAFAELEEKDALHVYAEVFQTEEEANEEDVSKIIAEYREHLQERTRYHFGYPYNLHYDHMEIFDLMRFSINNLGDPFVESNYGVHSRKFECEVVGFFANLWKIPEGEYWGYVTSCGTEGNLHSIIVARETFPDGILYASSETHYSVFKGCKFYRMESVSVESDVYGVIDYEALRGHLTKNKDKPAIIVANVGTTVRGAVDDVHKIVQVLKEVGYTEDRFFIHCDGALYALMLPFMTEYPQINFDLPISSMCVSGHKFLGCPMPCGVTICRKKLVHKITTEIEYLNSVDTTIMGSRNGHAPIYLWYSIKKGGIKKMEEKVRICHANALLLFNMLKEAGIRCMLNPQSTTVVLERPPEDFVKKWQLACQGDIAHVVVMPNVTTAKIVEFSTEVTKALKGDFRIPMAPLASPTIVRREVAFPKP